MPSKFTGPQHDVLLHALVSQLRGCDVVVMSVFPRNGYTLDIDITLRVVSRDPGPGGDGMADLLEGNKNADYILALKALSRTLTDLDEAVVLREGEPRGKIVHRKEIVDAEGAAVMFWVE